MDGSSFIEDGVRKAGHRIVSLQKITGANPLPLSTLAPKAKLIAFTRALQLRENL